MGSMGEPMNLNRTIKIDQRAPEREQTENQQNSRASETCEAITEGTIFVSPNFHREKKRYSGKIFKEIMTKKIPKFGKRQKFEKLSNPNRINSNIPCQNTSG
jgi:hypothetical protein